MESLSHINAQVLRAVGRPSGTGETVSQSYMKHDDGSFSIINEDRYG